jgi:CheY-like chemotaxis protein
MPMAWCSVSPAINRSRGAGPTSRRWTVLVVQREEAVRERIRGILEADGHAVVEAEDVLDTLETILSHGRPVDLVLSDLIEPGLTGPRGLLKRLASTTRVLLLSLFPGEEVILQDPGHDVALLQNPFRPDALGKKVRELLDDRKK